MENQYYQYSEIIKLLPFKDVKAYYSGSIKGSPEPDPEFAWKLVQYIGLGGGDVLSEHVAARNLQEMESIRAKRIGEQMQQLINSPEPWFGVRTQDIAWVEEATHMVALINAPSHGVGMEIERAILKPRLGLPYTPILCLTRRDLFEKTSYMIRGVTPEEHRDFYIKPYNDLLEATRHIHHFLTSPRVIYVRN